MRYAPDGLSMQIRTLSDSLLGSGIDFCKINRSSLRGRDVDSLPFGIVEGEHSCACGLCRRLICPLGLFGYGSCARCWMTEGSRLATALGGLLTITFFDWPYFCVLRSSGSHFPTVVPYQNTRYWTLPRGSVIAYSEFDPRLERR